VYLGGGVPQPLQHARLEELVDLWLGLLDAGLVLRSHALLGLFGLAHHVSHHLPFEALHLVFDGFGQPVLHKSVDPVSHDFGGGVLHSRGVDLGE